MVAKGKRKTHQQKRKTQFKTTQKRTKTAVGGQSRWTSKIKLRNLLIKAKNKFTEIKAKPEDNWNR